MTKPQDCLVSVRAPKALVHRITKNLPLLDAELRALPGWETAGVKMTISLFLRIAAEKLSTFLEDNHARNGFPPKNPPSSTALPTQSSMFPSEKNTSSEEKNTDHAKVSPRAIAKHPWPADFMLTPARIEYAMERLSCTAAEVREHWEHFEAHHSAHRSVFVDWGKAWVTWILREKQQLARQSRMHGGRRAPSTLEERVQKAASRFKRE